MIITVWHCLCDSIPCRDMLGGRILLDTNTGDWFVAQHSERRSAFHKPITFEKVMFWVTHWTDDYWTKKYGVSIPST